MIDFPKGFAESINFQTQQMVNTPPIQPKNTRQLGSDYTNCLGPQTRILNCFGLNRHGPIYNAAQRKQMSDKQLGSQHRAKRAHAKTLISDQSIHYIAQRCKPQENRNDVTA